MTQTRAKHNFEELLASDYNTPTTNRTISKRRSTKRGKTNKDSNKQVPIIITMPLELDSQSSSEPTDDMPMRCWSVRRRTSRDLDPNKNFATETFHQSTTIDTTHKDSLKTTRPPSALEACRRPSNGAPVPTKKKCKIETQENSFVSEKAETYLSLTLPIRLGKAREDYEELSLAEEFPIFVPGNCSIEEVLKMYGSVVKEPDTSIHFHS